MMLINDGDYCNDHEIPARTGGGGGGGITPTCIDLILTNKKNLFKLSNTFETGILDHHKLVSTILKSGSFKGTPKIKIYRSYKKFELEN